MVAPVEGVAPNSTNPDFMTIKAGAKKIAPVRPTEIATAFFGAPLRKNPYCIFAAYAGILARRQAQHIMDSDNPQIHYRGRNGSSKSRLTRAGENSSLIVLSSSLPNIPKKSVLC